MLNGKNIYFCWTLYLRQNSKLQRVVITAWLTGLGASTTGKPLLCDSRIETWRWTMPARSTCVSLATGLVSFMKSPNKTKEECFLAIRQSGDSGTKPKLLHGVHTIMSITVFCLSEAKVWGRDLRRFSLTAQMFAASASYCLLRARATAFQSVSSDAVGCWECPATRKGYDRTTHRSPRSEIGFHLVSVKYWKWCFWWQAVGYTLLKWQNHKKINSATSFILGNRWSCRLSWWKCYSGRLTFIRLTGRKL